MENTGRNLGHIIIFAIIVALTFLADLLMAHVTLSVAELYSLSFVTQFSLLQILGVFCIKSLVFFDYAADKAEKKEDEKWYEGGFKKVALTTFHILLVWGIAFLTFSILS